MSLEPDSQRAWQDVLDSNGYEAQQSALRKLSQGKDDTQISKLDFRTEMYKIRQLELAVNIYCTGTDFGLDKILPSVMKHIRFFEPISDSILVSFAEHCYHRHERSKGPLMDYVRDAIRERIDSLNENADMDRIIREGGQFAKDFVEMIREKMKRNTSR